jgi:hypothetical protein
MRATSAWLIVAVMLAAGCSLKLGHPFPSPTAANITIGTTDKTFLRRAFGEPYQVGLDSGDETWRWFFAEHSSGAEVSKDLTVRFNANGTVKSYSFMSNFPQDMAKLK